MMYGYSGSILHVDLTHGAVKVEHPSDDLYRSYVGGSALGLYFLFKHTPPGIDALDPDNTLVFMLSGVTGAPISGQSRATVVAKSPLTNCVGDSQAGGYWPAELKFAGFDGLVIHGRAPSPVYLWIHDGQCELRDGAHLWGNTTRETEALIAKELGSEHIEVAQIGPAGEKCVRFASIMNMSNRAHGRTGMGAVMGSKNLKAIAVRGTNRRIPIADIRSLMELAKQSNLAIGTDFDMEDLSRYGTAGIVESQNLVGGLVTRNWQSGYLGTDRAQMLSGKRLYDELLRGAATGEQRRLGRDSCFACAVRCKRVVQAEWEGRAIDPKSGGPEYEAIAALGSYCGIDDLRAVAYANQLCNQYGADTISAGATMAFAIECFEAGLITAKDTGGLQLGWGRTEAIVSMLEMTLRREGLGDILAEGSARAAVHIGKGADSFLMTAKNQEFPAHMPHLKRSLALIYATNPFGADHQSSEHDVFYEPDVYELMNGKYRQRLTAIGLTSPQPADALNREKVSFALRTQYAMSAIDTASVCHFVFGPTFQLMGMDELATMISAVTGWDMTTQELMTLGARRLNMLRAFNAREGINRDHDALPSRIFQQPLQGGPSDGVTVDKAEFEQALDLYFDIAGWDRVSGNPTRQTLEKLGLQWLADEFLPTTFASIGRQGTGGAE